MPKITKKSRKLAKDWQRLIKSVNNVVQRTMEKTEPFASPGNLVDRRTMVRMCRNFCYVINIVPLLFMLVQENCECLLHSTIVLDPEFEFQSTSLH